ncbi:MAG: IclR family transcriptional regulator [Anaerolineales bacterium]|nr:IclR family transcriptional regulator [Anaerolineales bacterium]
MSLLKDSMVKNHSVIKSFAILEFLADVQTPKDLGVISSELGMNKSTLYRFLTTLVQLGYANQDSHTGKYSLGPKILWLASRFLESLDIRNLSRPLLERLVEVTGETVHLAILDNYEVVYIDKVDGHQPVRMISSVGNRMPAHSTGLGKALLASLDEDEWYANVENIGLKSYTTNTMECLCRM